MKIKEAIINNKTRKRKKAFEWKKRKEQLNPYGVGSQVSTTQKLVVIIGQQKGAKYLGQIMVLLAVEQKRKLEVEK